MSLGFKRFDHVALYIDDIEKTKDFYLNILEFELEEEWVRDWDGTYLAFIRKGDLRIEFVKKPYGKTFMDGPINHIAFEVEDIRETHKALMEKGVVFESEGFACDTGLGEKGLEFILFRGPSNERLQIFASR